MKDKNKSQLIIYQTESGETKIDVRFQNETVWLSQQLLAELFQTTKQNVSLHIGNIYEDGELVPQATVTIKIKNKKLSQSSKGDGPVDACYKAIEKLTKIKVKLLDYSIRAVTSGKDAIGEVNVRLKVGQKEASGRGASTDIIEASVKAYLNAMNKVVRR